MSEQDLDKTDSNDKNMAEADTREDSEMVESLKEGTSPRLEGTSAATPPQVPAQGDIGEAVRLLNNFVSDRSKFGGATIDDAIRLVTKAATEAEHYRIVTEEIRRLNETLRDERYRLANANIELRAEVEQLKAVISSMADKIPVGTYVEGYGEAIISQQEKPND